MTALAATGWALGALLLQQTIGFVVLSTRRGPDLVSGFACQAIAYLLCLFVILRVHGPEAGIRDFVGMRSTSALLLPVGLILGAALNYPAGALDDVIERRWPSKLDEIFQQLIDGASPRQLVVLALIIVLLGPMLEEVFFRGAIFRPMLRVHSPPIAIAVTAFLFAISHSTPQVILPIAILGLVLGFVRWVSGSLVPGMMIHIAFNAISFFGLVAHRGSTDSSPTSLRFAAGGGAIAAVGLGIAYLVGMRSVNARASRQDDLA